MLLAIALTLLTVFVYMSLFFLAALRKQNNTIVDMAWGGGFILLAVLNGILAESVFLRQWMILAFVILWGLRLIIHVYLRIRGRLEDFRYQQMRQRWGRKAGIRSFTRVFLFQGLLLKVSGMLLLEKRYADVPACQKYAIKTSVFIPWFSKK